MACSERRSTGDGDPEGDLRQSRGLSVLCSFSFSSNMAAKLVLLLQCTISVTKLMHHKEST